MRSAFALVFIAFVGSYARAQDGGTCDEPVGSGPLEMTPASGSRGVTLDAYIKWRYTPGHFEGWLDDPTELVAVQVDDGSGWTDVTGAAQIVGDYLFFLPDGGLLPDADYEVQALGTDFDSDVFSFSTVGSAATATDREPPDLGEIQEVASTRVDESCESPGGGYRVDVSFAPATDDGSPGSIEYLLYVTRGPLVQAPMLRARARNFTAGSEGVVTMAFVLASDEAVGPVCVTVHAVDGLGKVDRATVPYCFEPIQGNFFQALCSAVPGKRGGAPMWPLLVLAALVLRRCGR